MSAGVSTADRTERFTLQIQGKGLRFKARIPGWMVAAVIAFVSKDAA